MTNEEISNLSDNQLNLAIMGKLGLAPIETWETYQEDNRTVHACTYKADPVDYCNNWNDLMPLVVEYGIGSQQEGDNHFSAWDYYEEFSVARSTLQRALAECLFLVLQEKANNE